MDYIMNKSLNLAQNQHERIQNDHPFKKQTNRTCTSQVVLSYLECSIKNRAIWKQRFLNKGRLYFEIDS